MWWMTWQDSSFRPYEVDPKDKKLAALEGRVEELTAIIPPINDVKTQLEERKDACRALKTQLDRAKVGRCMLTAPNPNEKLSFTPMWSVIEPPTECKLKAPGHRSELQYDDEVLSSFAFTFSLRHYTKATIAAFTKRGGEVEGAKRGAGGPKKVGTDG
jgi:hypothetical protein